MFNIGKKLALIGLALAAAGATYATPAAAQATRTWVSGEGDDVNPCSRTAPCKTFAGAISKTAAGGEINCLDPGGYGAVTITKAMTIDCHYVEGGVLAGGNGITINAAATDVVMLRGLDFFGVNPPQHGVRFVAGGALHIEDSIIRRFNASGSYGVQFVPTTRPAELFISNTTIADNGLADTGGGIQIKPAVGGGARVVLRDVRIRNNAQDGIQVDSTNGSVGVTIDDSDISGNKQGMAVVGGASNARVMVTNTLISVNASVGIVTTGATATVRLGNTTVTGNGQGLAALSSSSLLSYGNNRVEGNPINGAANDGTFTGPATEN